MLLNGNYLSSYYLRLTTHNRSLRIGAIGEHYYVNVVIGIVNNLLSVVKLSEFM